jgi:hypothetical protein
MTIVVQTYNTKKHISLNFNPTLLINIRGFYQCVPLSFKSIDSSLWKYLPLWSYESSDFLKIYVGIICIRGTFFYWFMFKSGICTKLIKTRLIFDSPLSDLIKSRLIFYSPLSDLIKSRLIFDSPLSDVLPCWNNLLSLSIQCRVAGWEMIYILE